MKSSLWMGGLLAVALALPALSSAQEKVSLKAKQKRAEAQAQLDESVQHTNEQCGTSIAATIDWVSFKGAETGSQSVPSYCEAPLTAVNRLCGEDMGKEAVQKGVKKVVCAYGGKGKRSLEAKGGTVTYKVDWDAANSEDFAHERLQEVL